MRSSTSQPAAWAACLQPPALRDARVLLAGLGNIGSFLAVLMAPLVGFLRLVDRDIVEPHNTVNQFYGPQDAGRYKVDVVAERVAALAPHVVVERRAADLADLPWGDFADVGVGLAGLDSLRARQLVAGKLCPLQVPYIDGGVGDGLLIRCQVLLPWDACLECSWGPDHYRQLSTEYPCTVGAAAEAPQTVAPGCAGAATAALMAAQCTKLFANQLPKHSYEVNGDLLHGRVVTSRRRRNTRCRFPHEATPRLARLPRPIGDATVSDVLAGAAAELSAAPASLRFEFRPGLLDRCQLGAGLFPSSGTASWGELAAVAHRRLESLGLTPRDRIVVRAGGRRQPLHLCFQDT